MAASLGEGQLRIETHACQVCWTCLTCDQGSGPVLWTYAGRKTLPPSTSLPVMDKIAGVSRHHWADIFIVRRQGPDGRKGSTNSTATCSTWRGMGSRHKTHLGHKVFFSGKEDKHEHGVGFLVHKDIVNTDGMSPDDNIQPYRIGRRPGQQGPRLSLYTRTEMSSVLLVHHRRFEEETTSPSALGTQGH